MAQTDRHNIDNTPNTLPPYEVLTSYTDGIYQPGGNEYHQGGNAGFGSLARRSVATEMAMYKPYDNALDTLIQVTGGFEVATSSVHEWTEHDELMPDESTASATNLAGTGTTGTITLTDGGEIFRKGDVIRYVSTTGYVYSYITDVTGDVLTVASINGDNLPAAVLTSGNNVVQRMHSLRGADRNYDVEPRGSIPRQYYTYINKIVHDARYGARVQNEEHYLDLLDEQESKLFSEMRRSRELQSLYGVQGKEIVLGNGDVVYSSPGLYTEISGFNKDTHEVRDSSGILDKDKFKNAMNEFIEFNFGGESGGPDQRTMFISGKFGSYLSQAFEDKQRFYGTEFIAGVRSMRYEHNLGVIDFIHLPVLDYKHPIPNGSLKQSEPLAVGMLCPVDECVDRLVMQGEGPTSEVFKEKGGDVEENMRVTTTEGMKLKLRQYTAVWEESLA